MKEPINPPYEIVNVKDFNLFNIFDIRSFVENSKLFLNLFISSGKIRSGSVCVPSTRKL